MSTPKGQLIKDIPFDAETFEMLNENETIKNEATIESIYKILPPFDEYVN